MAVNGIFSDWIAAFRRGDMVVRLIYINVAAFILLTLVSIVCILFKWAVMQWMDYLKLPAWGEQLVCQPWSLLTYMFMHAGVLHLLFNLLWLYWFGRLFLQLYSSKHLRGLYLLGGLAGGLLYLLAYNVFPYFQDLKMGSYLVGASASVLAIVVATAEREPDYPVQFMFVGSVRLKYVALFMIALDLLFMTSGNAGGHIAHLGGALAGWLFAAGLRKGQDWTKGINWVLDRAEGVICPRARKPKMKVYYGEKQKDYDYNARKKQQSEEIDRILDKLRKSGYGSLTESEKKSLFDASKK